MARIQRLEATIRSFVNGYFAGSDPYQTLKTISFFVLLWKLANKCLQISKSGFRAYVMTLLLPWIKMLPAVQKKLTQEGEKLKRQIEPEMLKDIVDARTALPSSGMPQGDLLSLMEKRLKVDRKYWEDGKVTGSIYHGEQDYMDFIGRVYDTYRFNVEGTILGPCSLIRSLLCFEAGGP